MGCVALSTWLSPLNFIFSSSKCSQWCLFCGRCKRINVRSCKWKAPLVLRPILVVVPLLWKPSVPHWLISKCGRMGESESPEAPWLERGNHTAQLLSAAEEERELLRPEWSKHTLYPHFDTIILSFKFYNQCVFVVKKKKKKNQTIQKHIENIVNIPFNCRAIPFTSPEMTTVKSVCAPF